VLLFPDGGIHSAYLDLVRSPPNGIDFVGDFKYGIATSYNIRHKKYMMEVCDYMNWPYMTYINSDLFIHSCQKLLYTNSDYVIDIEHGNPFMGSNHVFKHKYLLFKYIVKKIISKDNCKFILPWSEKAKGAFCRNFSFLGKEILDDKVRVVYPCVAPSNVDIKKFDKFTFIFVCGESFFAKGGYQILEAFKVIKDTKLFDCDLIIVGDIPGAIMEKFKHLSGLWCFNRLHRNDLLQTISRCHCALLPSYSDVYGMFLIEAKRFGVPSIVVDNFAASEIITDEKTGLVIPPDSNVNMWFDEYGCKRMSRDEFRSQFNSYVPSDMHVSNLVYAMNQIHSSNINKMSEECIRETTTGRFSIAERDRRLEGVYQ
jgi:glycosyltransferase involved in cell wall biosynthesis